MERIPERIDYYRIEEKLGEGGMGMVYRAHDESLDRPVAIKLIRPETLSHPTIRERFRREALTAAALNHPSIVHIHRILPDQEPDTTTPHCIVMEYVEGQTLKSLLEDGAMDVEAALPLLQQLAKGLAYAHGKGIVHRDIKADNVMVTREGHARILDFGLAKHLLRDDPNLSQDNRIMGTPQCMSPEQARGLKVDHRSDLFSFGVLAYQMLTGNLPFQGETNLELFNRIIVERHVSAHTLNPSLPLALSLLIDRLLEKRPQARPESDEVSAQIQRIISGDHNFSGPRTHPDLAVDTVPHDQDNTPRLGKPWVSQRFKKWLPLLAGGFILSLAATLLFFQEPRRPTVAILSFGEEARGPWLTTVLYEILSADGTFRVLPSKDVFSFAEQLALPRGRPLEKETLHQMRETLRADYVILGSTSPANSTTRVIIQQTQRGNVSINDRLEDPAEDPYAVVLHVVDTLRGAVDAPPLSAEEMVEARNLLPATQEILEAYTKAAHAFAHHRTDLARSYVEAVAEYEDPWLFSIATKIYGHMGLEDKARMAAERATTLAADLPRKRQLETEAIYYWMIDDWEKAVDTHSQLVQEHPDEPGYGLLVAVEQTWNGQSQQALKGLSLIDQDLLTSAQAAWSDTHRARALIELQRFPEAIELCRRAGPAAEAAGAWEAAAHASFLEGRSLLELDRVDEALVAFKESLPLFIKAGAEGDSILAMQEIATFSQLTVKMKVEFLTLAHERYQRHEQRLPQALSANNLGLEQIRLGEFEKALVSFEEAAAIYRQLGLSIDYAEVVQNVGIAYHERGELEAARKYYQQARDVFLETEEDIQFGVVQVNLAEIATSEKRLDEARKIYDQALKTFEENGLEEEAGYVRMRRGELSIEMNELEEARGELTRAVELIDDAVYNAEAKTALARLEILSNNFGRANDLAVEAAATFGENSMLDERARALALQAQAQLAGPAPDFELVRELVDSVLAQAQYGQNSQTCSAAAQLMSHFTAKVGQLDEETALVHRIPSGSFSPEECGLLPP